MATAAPEPSIRDPKMADYLQLLKQQRKQICASKASARKFLVDHGFLTKSGKLPKRYGG